VAEMESLLLERERELASLEALIEGVAAGRAQVALIEGSAGIGKSLLLAALEARAAAQGFHVLAGRASILEREFTFGTVRQLFEPLLEDPTVHDRLLVGAAAGAASVFAALEDAAEERVADASFAALNGLYWLTANVAAESTLVSIDDLHWCDVPSLRFLAYLARRLEGLPILLVGTLRPTEIGGSEVLVDEIARAPSAVCVRPDPLSQAGVQELVERRLGPHADEGFVDACHAATGGNPLLLDQLLASLVADGVRPDADHISVVRNIGPRAVSRTVLSRLGRLPGEAVDVARAVAVLGDRAELPAIAALAGLDEPAVGEAADGLVGADILRPHVPLGFVHPLVRDAVYEDLPPARRELQHATAAEILRDAGASAEQVAAHLLLTSGRGLEWIVDSLLDAGRTATRRGAPDSAVAYLRHALEEPPPPDRHSQVLLELGLAEALTDAPAAAEHLRAAYDALADPAQRAAVARVLGQALVFTGSSAKAAALFRQAAADLNPEHDDLRQGLQALELGAIYFGAGDPEPPLDRLHPHRPPRRDDGVGAKMLAAVIAYGQVHRAGPARDCVELALAALAGGQLIEVDGGYMAMAAVIPLILADSDEVDAAFEEALAVAHRQGSLFSLSAIHLWQGFALLQRGELVDAEDLLKTALREVKLYGYAAGAIQYWRAFLAATQLERGDTSGGRRALGRAPRAEDRSFAAHSWLLSELRLLVAEGHAQEALEAADELERRFGWIVNPAAGPWRSLKAEALDLLERRTEALALAEEELELARRFGAPGPVGRALRVLGTLEREAGLDHLRAAVAILPDSSARLEHAKALAALGAALRRSGNRAEAREPLREALDLAERCGAEALADQARDELSATGARPRRTVLYGVDALTPSELRIARMAAEGISNREIAQALYVTIRTVEMHLTHGYQKLDISSRTELPDALGPGVPQSAGSH
jgi:DNA-binding CsgD family transcriptional regulator/tetratricopeptide (TPR) repeat protein